METMDIPQVQIVDSPELLDRVCRFRYQTYIKELGTAYGQVELTDGMLKDELDEFAITMYAEHEGEIIGTARINFGCQGEFDEYWFECYKLHDFPEPDKICLGSKMMISPKWRKTKLSTMFLAHGFMLCKQYQADFIFLDCIPPLVRMYERMGYRRYKDNAPEDVNLKYYVPIVAVVNDSSYLESIGSPWAAMMLETETERASTIWFNKWIKKELGISFEPLLPIETLWNEIAHLDNVPSLFRGLSEDQIKQVLPECTFLQVKDGESISYQGDTCDSLFLLTRGKMRKISGTKDDVTVHEIIYPGTTMGVLNYLKPGKRGFSFRAGNDSTVMVITQHIRGQIKKKYPDIFIVMEENILRINDLDKTPYVHTEKTISEDAGVEIPFPIRVFDLQKWGINQEVLLNVLAQNVPNLTWDEYDLRKARLRLLNQALPDFKNELNDLEPVYYSGEVEEEALASYIDILTEEDRVSFWDIKPHRRRSICQFIAERTNDGNWEIKRIVEDIFTQNVDDLRKIERVFEQTNDATTEHPEFKRFLHKLVDQTLEFKPEARKIKMVAHEMATVTKENRLGDNSPEGVHQDGSQFIVSAMVVERKDITGGYSEIYGPDKKTSYFKYTMQPGEGLFQMDRGTNLWHKVSSIYLKPDAEVEIGERNIVGFDIDVIE